MPTTAVTTLIPVKIYSSFARALNAGSNCFCLSVVTALSCTRRNGKVFFAVRGMFCSQLFVLKILLRSALCLLELLAAFALSLTCDWIITFHIAALLRAFAFRSLGDYAVANTFAGRPALGESLKRAFTESTVTQTVPASLKLSSRPFLIS